MLPSDASIFDRRLDTNRVRILRFVRVGNVHGEDPQGLECSLREMDFPEAVVDGRTPPFAGEYNALSYVWGDQSDCVSVVCNGKTAEITRNLAHSLHRLWTKDPGMLIWADALCINQGDAVEKSDQVSIMGAIYQRASTVHGWLGTPTSASEPPIATLVEVYNEVRDKIRLETVSSTLHRQTIVLPLERMQQLASKGSKALTVIYNNPWFSRAWTVQESLLASRLIFHYGDETMDARLLLRIASILNTICKQCYYRTAPKNLIYSIARGDLESEALMGDFEREPSMDLTTLRFRYRKRQATEERDRIYSLLSLWQPTREKTLHPHYNIPITTALIRAARATVEADNTLDTLVLAVLQRRWGREQPTFDHQPYEVPSWVPLARTPYIMAGRAGRSEFYAPYTSLFATGHGPVVLDDPADIGGNIMHLRGTAVGRLISKTFPQKKDPSRDELRWMIEAFPECVTCHASIAHASANAHNNETTGQEEGTDACIVVAGLSSHNEHHCTCVRGESQAESSDYRFERWQITDAANKDLVVLFDGCSALFILHPNTDVPSPERLKLTFQLTGNVLLGAKGRLPHDRLLSLARVGTCLKYVQQRNKTSGTSKESRSDSYEDLVRRQTEFWTSFQCIRSTFALC